jgi:acyl-coenzyme A synthetase/AMP-(fatty) acid ligase
MRTASLHPLQSSPRTPWSAPPSTPRPRPTAPPFAKWFVGGEVNAAYNALDRHVENGLGDRVAIYFEGEPGGTRTYTYAQLTEEVKKAANAFESLGVAKGDRVAVYLPMIPEAVITLLACARIGAVHSVVFGGLSADALRSRIDDAEARLVVTADGTYRNAPRRCEAIRLRQGHVHLLPGRIHRGQARHVRPHGRKG